MGFLDGLSVRLARKSVTSAMTWALYEEALQWMNQYNTL